MLVSLLAQVAPSQPAPAVAPQHAEWVVLALALITTLGNIVLAIVRRTSSVRIAAAEKVASTAKAKTAENAEKLGRIEATVTEHTHRIDDLDERFCAVPAELQKLPADMQRLADRFTVMEGDMRAEKAAREARREDQHRQEISLTKEFSSLATTVTSLSKQVEKLNER